MPAETHRHGSPVITPNMKTSVRGPGLKLSAEKLTTVTTPPPGLNLKWCVCLTGMLVQCATSTRSDFL
eukprot:2447641-Rhodomonas_salina.2